ncbi:FAD-dependent oxidoreductase [Acetobacteraceae bacterium KSS8]|uniref:FAD-dependent oxidoreductase n=1 Tax=Endosaccharibacter trunci TaxID=2812733 RepID=A0ABT1W8Q2_9PROT|nr:FAD-dependent oxidoreductase [Acetobacteraceae bacterium KSS8]
MRVAIIGAGIAGLSCAGALRRAGHLPVLFEKSRGVGGRVSTRRAGSDGASFGFDHGAQYMTARDPAFRALMRQWEAAGLAAPWPDAGEDAWVGVPGMNAPMRALAENLDVRRDHRVTTIARAPSAWRVIVEDGAEETAEAVIVAAPSEQAPPLLAGIAPDWSALAADTVSDPCWTVMAAFETRVPVEANTLSKRAPIIWAARNSSKPGRQGPEAWVIQADPDWSRRHLEEQPDVVAPSLLSAFSETIRDRLPATTSLAAHRWRYAKSGRAERTALWDADRRLGVCGDWLVAPRVEGAFLSGTALAASILGER